MTLDKKTTDAVNYIKKDALHRFQLTVSDKSCFAIARLITRINEAGIEGSYDAIGAYYLTVDKFEHEEGLITQHEVNTWYFCTLRGMAERREAGTQQKTKWSEVYEK